MAWLNSQAKLHVALEMGDSTGDKGYSLGKGPPATGVKPDNSIELSRRVADAHKPHAADKGANGTNEEDARLQHSAAQVVTRCLCSICACWDARPTSQVSLAFCMCMAEGQHHGESTI